MNIVTILEALVKLGIPMVVLSWLIFNLLYGEGDLDRKADRKTTDAQVKSMKKSLKKSKVGHKNYLLSKWMWFGSGFYGLAALWTFAVMEVIDIIGVIFNPSRIAAVFENGLVAGAIDLMMNQIGNIVSAFVWFNYWGEGSVVTWLAVAYFGYWLGTEIARRDDDTRIAQWIEKLKSQRS